LANTINSEQQIPSEIMAIYDKYKDDIKGNKSELPESCMIAAAFNMMEAIRNVVEQAIY